MAAGLHPALSGLGPDLCADEFDAAEAQRRLRDPSRAALTIAEALLDQRALAGIGNVFKSEILFIERVDPFMRVGDLEAATLARLVDRARALLLANRTAAVRVTTGSAGGGAASVATPGQSREGSHWVYGRAGRPCRRCRAPIASRRHGDPPRTTSWCPQCQASDDRPEQPPDPRVSLCDGDRREAEQGNTGL